MLAPAAAAALVAASASGSGPMCTDSKGWLNGTDFHGDGQGLGHAPGKDAADCCAQCAKLQNCSFFTYVYSTSVVHPSDPHTCWFFVDSAWPRWQEGSISGWTANRPPPVPPMPPTAAPTLDPHLVQLEQKYGALHNQTCAQVLHHIPVLPARDAAAFLSVYQSFNGTGCTGYCANTTEAAVLHTAQRLLSRADVKAFLAGPDSFVQKGGLDAAMVRCAVMSEATPEGLAEFAVQGKDEEALVDRLLNDALLMRDMLVAGGAAPAPLDDSKHAPLGAQYGQAMSIYTRILDASAVLSGKVGGNATGPWDDRSQSKTGILRRLALGTAVEHAAPYTNIDPVARYLHFESAYLAGDLDPAFEVLTAFECRYVTNDPHSDEDLLWVRQTLPNFRPDAIAKKYTCHVPKWGTSNPSSWRYSSTVHEVSYSHSSCVPGICNGSVSDYPAGGGECGIRAFYTRTTRRTFGVPVWGVTQHGHAAMSSWAPEGWQVMLGARDWDFNYWAHRTPAQSGSDFHLLAQAREVRPAFQQVLRGGWAARALGEEPVGLRWTPASPGTGENGYGQGGVWGALMLYLKKLTVAAAAAATGTLPGAANWVMPPRPVGPSVVPTKVAALLANWTKVGAPLTGIHPGHGDECGVPQHGGWQQPNITTGADGTIHIPAAAYTMNQSAAFAVMKSFDGGEQALHTGKPLEALASSAFGYEITVDAAGTYFLTVNFTTWHPNQDLLVSITTTTTSSTTTTTATATITTTTTTATTTNNQTVPVFYARGYWKETLPVEVKLLKGTNLLTFQRWSDRPIAIKEFFLFKKKPVVPPPPSNYTPAPTQPFSPYIEVGATTSCAGQGLSPVPDAKECAEACASLNLTYTGTKAYPNMTGCFATASGPSKGAPWICKYNTNASATCPPGTGPSNPPCTVGGNVARALCRR